MKSIEELRKIYDWNTISRCIPLTQDEIIKFEKYLNWETLSGYQKLSEDTIDRFKNKVNWRYISSIQDLSENFISKFENLVYWDRISYSQILSEDFIRKFRDKLKNSILKYQKLSEKFICDNFDGLHESDKNTIRKYQNITSKMMTEYSGIDLFPDKMNMNNMNIDDRIALLKTLGFECHENYFIGYSRSINSYDYLNFRNKYVYGECIKSRPNSNIGINLFPYKSESDLKYNDIRSIKCHSKYEDIIMKNGGFLSVIVVSVSVVDDPYNYHLLSNPRSDESLFIHSFIKLRENGNI